MTIIRAYKEQDAAEVGLLIRDTYSEFNLSFLPPKDQARFLGPFQFAGRTSPDHIEAIRNVIRSEMVYVAEDQGLIVGVLRGRMDRLGSLFVVKSHHSQGVGRLLVEKFEKNIKDRGGKVIRVASSMYAVPFYLKMGYKKSTGVRNSWSFQGYGLQIQPMRKVFPGK